MSRGTHRPRRSTRPHLTALGRAVGIEQRFPKPRVGSSTLPRPTTLDLSFSSSSTIPSLRRNAPKWCKCHKSVIVFGSRRGQTDQNESRPVIPRAEQHLKLRPAIQARSASECCEWITFGICYEPCAASKVERSGKCVNHPSAATVCFAYFLERSFAITSV